MRIRPEVGMDERDERRTPADRAERGRRSDQPSRPPGQPPEDGPRTAGPPTIQLGRAGRPPGILALAIVVFVAIAFVKPWPQAARPGPQAEPPRPVPAVATPQPTADPLAALRSNCEEPLGWRAYSVERWTDQTLRIWRSLQPATSAVDATDTGIPVIPLGPAVELVGYCSPWDGAERPPAESRLTAWSVQPHDGAARVEPIELDLVAPRPASVLGALFGSPATGAVAASPPPTSVPAEPSDRPSPQSVPTGRPTGGPGPSAAPSSGAAIWPSGHFVFELSAPGWHRWWAVDIPPPAVAQPG
jgi:hypothetical protein